MKPDLNIYQFLSFFLSVSLFFLLLSRLPQQQSRKNQFAFSWMRMYLSNQNQLKILKISAVLTFNAHIVINNFGAEKKSSLKFSKLGEQSGRLDCD